MEIKNTSWPFYLDHIETWAYGENVLTKEECKKLIKIGKSLQLKKAGVGAGKLVDLNKEEKNKIRKSKISWIFPTEELNFIYRKLTDCIMQINNDFFKFDITGFLEGLQFTYYDTSHSHYIKHTDRSKGCLIRKLSFSILLNDPSEYEGGDFCLYDSDKPIVLPKKQGMLLAFPSYTLHEVKPVTKGKRISLVCWITGPNFK